jgi:hypothetical protein
MGSLNPDRRIVTGDAHVYRILVVYTLPICNTAMVHLYILCVVKVPGGYGVKGAAGACFPAGCVSRVVV